MSVIYDKFVLFGDSLTQFSSDQSLEFGFGAALNYDYQRKLDVVTRGFSGYTSEHAIRLLPRILDAEHRPGTSEVKLMTIFFGTNDATTRPVQQVGLERYEANLRQLIGLAQEKKIKIIVIGPGLRDARMRDEEDFGSNQRARDYGRRAEQVAGELQVPFIDMFSLMQQDGGFTEADLVNSNHAILSKYLTDGIHYTGHSYRLLYHGIKSAINGNFPELDSEVMLDHFPYYRDIDPHNIDECLFGAK